MVDKIILECRGLRVVAHPIGPDDVRGAVKLRQLVLRRHSTPVLGSCYSRFLEILSEDGCCNTVSDMGRLVVAENLTYLRLFC